MNQYYYTVIPCLHYDEDNEFVRSFGIALDFGTQRLAKIVDILPSRTAVEQLAQLMNEMELSPTHFADVVEDYIEMFAG